MDQELIQYLDGQFNEVNDRIDEFKRHNGVLIEGLRRDIQLVAEGLTMHIQVQHVQEREYFERKFADTHALIRSSYDHLQQRVENLERRGQS